MSAEDYRPQADGFPEKFCFLQNAEGAKALCLISQAKGRITAFIKSVCDFSESVASAMLFFVCKKIL